MQKRIKNKRLNIIEYIEYMEDQLNNDHEFQEELLILKRELVNMELSTTEELISKCENNIIIPALKITYQANLYYKAQKIILSNIQRLNLITQAIINYDQIIEIENNYTAKSINFKLIPALQGN